MPIQLGDIKLVASAVMDDVPEGGGAPSSHIIEDNERNEIFKDISESDRARGRFNAAKVFVSVQTDDTDTYLGANAIVAKPPEDPNVSITMFTTNSVYDTRKDAVARLEAYLNKGPEWAGFLYENHIAGQRAIQLFQRVGSSLPEVGQTLCLVQDEELPTQKEQYVRAVRVTGQVRTFTDSANNNMDYQALIVTVEISDPLRYDFKGTPANRQFTVKAGTTKTRDTLVADAANYVGVVPLTTPVAIGDFSIQVASVFTPLVPSAQVETPILATTPIATSGVPARIQQNITYTSNQQWTSTTALSLPGGCTAGTLSIVVSGTTIVDAGGLLKVADTQVGTIDYANGILSLNSGAYNASKTISYEPAAYIPRMPQSFDIMVTLESRSLNYVGFIDPTPMPGTTTVSYLAQGRWYTLADAGDGALRGAETAFGAGTVNSTTGAFAVTLGALPDVGSAVIVQWGVPTQETVQPGGDVKLAQTISLNTPEVGPTYLTAIMVDWLDGGVSKHAQTVSDGTLTGDATGSANTFKKTLLFAPNALPPAGTMLNVAYDYGDADEENLPHPSRGGDGKVSVTAQKIPLIAGTVQVQWNTLTDLAPLKSYTRDQLAAMGISTLVDPIQFAQDNGAGKLYMGTREVGTVDYTTGVITFNPDVTVRLPDLLYTPARGQTGQPSFGGMTAQQWRLNYAGIRYVDAPSVYPNDESGWVKLNYRSTGSATRIEKTVPFTVDFELIPGLQAPVVPGSVLLQPTSGGVISDSGAGVMRELTDSGWLQRGTINYANGAVTLDNWSAGMASIVRRTNAVTTTGGALNSAYVFRTAAAPLRPGSLTIQYAGADGGTKTVTAAINGTITAAGVTGTVDYQTGLVRLGFGTLVTAAGNEDEPWYSEFSVVDGMIFKPAPVLASTVKYTAVAYSYMPLNADLVGVDPVRLPSDGRVPIFRTGTMVVIGNTKETGPLVPSNGQVINLARTRLSRALVRDKNGKAVHTGYSVDLEAGLLTFNEVAGIETPVVVEDRIEDMAVVREVAISGDMTFTRQITHDYPVAGTYVSSALEFGDRKARVNVTFDQATWNGVEWADSPTSAVAAGTYNTTLAPIVVTNAGASTERWGLWFTSTAQFRVIGEHVGQIATGDINTDCAPINPATGEPYFEIKAIGWGTGWANGNVLRVNTIGALAPVWIVRTVQPGPEAGIDYSFDLLTRGDVDRP